MQTTKHSIVIVDDELPALNNMQYVLGQHPHWELLASCHSTAQARRVLEERRVDLLLLDIEMPTQSGLEFAREISQHEHVPLIVFITAYNKHAVAAFEIFALDYLLKPFDDERFAAMLARAEQSLQVKQQLSQSAALQDYFRDRDAEQAGVAPPTLSHVVVRTAGKIERIEMQEVLWISTAANYVELHLHHRTVLHRTTISALEERLPTDEFIRLHRTAIARASAISLLEISNDGSHTAKLNNGDEIKISDTYVKKVKQHFAR